MWRRLQEATRRPRTEASIAVSWRTRFLVELQQFLCVSPVDLVFLIGAQADPFDTPDRLANVDSRRRLEGHVGSKYDVIDSEELESAASRRERAEQCRVGIEEPEIIDGPLLHRLQQ